MPLIALVLSLSLALSPRGGTQRAVVILAMALVVLPSVAFRAWGRPIETMALVPRAASSS